MRWYDGMRSLNGSGNEGPRGGGDLPTMSIADQTIDVAKAHASNIEDQEIARTPTASRCRAGSSSADSLSTHLRAKQRYLVRADLLGRARESDLPDLAAMARVVAADPEQIGIVRVGLRRCQWHGHFGAASCGSCKRCPSARRRARAAPRTAATSQRAG